ncbi:hypothetical protein M432DRAFT_475473 [Thermoascus aurantiacus ATCC 26904]
MPLRLPVTSCLSSAWAGDAFVCPRISLASFTRSQNTQRFSSLSPDLSVLGFPTCHPLFSSLVSCREIYILQNTRPYPKSESSHRLTKRHIGHVLHLTP